LSAVLKNNFYFGVCGEFVCGKFVWLLCCILADNQTIFGWQVRRVKDK